MRKKPLFRRRASGWCGLVLGLTMGAPLAAEQEPDPEVDPCAHAYGQGDINACWAREADRARSEMNQVYLALRQKLPKLAAGRLEKAQGRWREFMEAHLQAVFGVESPRTTWGREFPMCLSISQTRLYRERTRQLKRMLEPDELNLCPL